MKNDSKLTLAVERIITNLVSSGLELDKNKFEINAIKLARAIRESSPETSKNINRMIAGHSSGHSSFRGVGVSPLPVDQESQLEMATVITPSDEFLRPILSPTINEQIDTFLDERKNIDLLLRKNIHPTTSLLLIGQPGTGKTMLSYHLASALNKNLVVLDLAASISSFLGKTGHNLKKVLNYAKQTSSVLLLDEFDAIAKRRDDQTDLGELKRVVNVLLMELESWPVSSVIIATSNHPELLDRAIWRRFDHILELKLPDQNERISILEREFTEYIENKEKNLIRIIPNIAELLSNRSASDICKYCSNAKRRSILKSEDIELACLRELVHLSPDEKKAKVKFIQLAKEIFGRSITVRELADMTGLSPSGVQYHITNK